MIAGEGAGCAGRAGEYWFCWADGGELEKPKPRAVFGAKAALLGMAYLLESIPAPEISEPNEAVEGVVVGVFG